MKNGQKAKEQHNVLFWHFLNATAPELAKEIKKCEEGYTTYMPIAKRGKKVIFNTKKMIIKVLTLSKEYVGGMYESKTEEKQYRVEKTETGAKYTPV